MLVVEGVWVADRSARNAVPARHYRSDAEGAVVDFLDFHAFGIHWPAFNFADSLIVLGTAMLLYDGLFGPASGS